jgi:protein SCO1/2|tara:strand:+ start:1255 stop:2058 length:804 start_codon:yes stop_codon:yes gene_type:complete
MMNVYSIILFIFINILYLISPIYPYEGLPQELTKIKISEHLGRKVPLNAFFINEKNEKVMLSDYFLDGVPVILSMTYFNCPMLCSLVLNGLTETIANLSLKLGKDFQVVTISFDPKDTVKAAKEYKLNYLSKLDMGAKQNKGWHFLVGNNIEINKVSSSIGFDYTYIPETQEFAHGAFIVILTPNGKISQYFYGIKYDSIDVKTAILNATNEKTRSTLEQILMYCFSYDPKKNTYIFQAITLMKISGAIVLISLFLLINLFIKKMRF